jgi:hypothetical protein
MLTERGDKTMQKNGIKQHFYVLYLLPATLKAAGSRPARTRGMLMLAAAPCPAHTLVARAALRR